MLKGMLPKRAMQAAGRYLKDHPEEVLRAAKNATKLRFGVPLVAVRWLVREVGGNKLPADLRLEAKDSGIAATASLELMKTPLRASATVFVERIDLSAEALLVELRVTDLKLVVTALNTGTPIAALLQSGALNLSRPGDLVSYLPKRSPILVEARGDRFILDLMKHPTLSKESARLAVRALIPLLTVKTVETNEEHLDIEFSALPLGVQEAMAQLKKLF